ncbi:MAG: DUF1566 domain-containing protein [Candidatus Contendobacter sp.]|nr:DUF1566 domain-containing protein [Candidatus Contendobacter sp.]
MELQDLCMGCMAENGGAAVCPQCGFAESQVTTGGGLYLPPRTVLNERYVIGRVLGQGGFGIIYLAFDVTLNLKLAIKEFLPRELAARGADGVSVSVYQDQARQLFAYGLEQFLAEARTLARLSEHPGIVTVRDFFVANGTGYLAMSYLDGLTLKDYVARKGGRLPFLAGFRALLPVMDALREVHQLGLLHRDISPDNIYLTRDKQVKLIDFGAARVALGERSKSLSVIFKPGFAPEEQYRSKGNQGPWTDVYALAGTLYYAITGHVPPEALNRLAEDTLSPPSALGVDIPPAAEAVLLKALAVRADGRYPTVEAFQQELMRTTVNRKEQEASPAPVVQTQWEQPVKLFTPSTASKSFPHPVKRIRIEPLLASDSGTKKLLLKSLLTIGLILFFTFLIKKNISSPSHQHSVLPEEQRREEVTREETEADKWQKAEAEAKQNRQNFLSQLDEMSRREDASRQRVKADERKRVEVEAERKRVEVEAEQHQREEEAARQQVKANERQRVETEVKAKAAYRYRDNKDGTVTDVQTGYQWMRCSVGQKWTGLACTGQAMRYEWRMAFDVTSKLNSQDGYAGEHDWRIPNKAELLTLVYCSSSSPKTWNDTGAQCQGDYESPTIYQPIFQNMPKYFFWSASDIANFLPSHGRVGSSFVSIINFIDGSSSNYSAGSDAYVRLVRGGQ